MLFKTRMMLTVGCVGVLAMSIPAFSLPSPRGIEQQRTQSHRTVQKKKVVQPARNGHSSRHATRENRAARLVSRPLSEPPKRPMFGWPALVSEARKYLGTNPTDRKRLWCATFMNLVLAKVGYAGTNSDAAKSFAYYGHRVSEPHVGAIAVLTRGKYGGHVGVVSGIDAGGNPIIISGNHGQRVGEAIYPRSRVIAYVMPSDRKPVNSQVAERGPPNASPSSSGIESPITELLAAIAAEQSRQESRAAPARRPEPQVPHRAVQQTSEQAPQPAQASHRKFTLDPALAEFLGIKDRAPSAKPPRQVPQRQRQVQQNQPGRVVAAETGLAGGRSLR